MASKKERLENICISQMTMKWFLLNLSSHLWYITLFTAIGILTHPIATTYLPSLLITTTAATTITITIRTAYLSTLYWFKYHFEPSLRHCKGSIRINVTQPFHLPIVSSDRLTPLISCSTICVAFENRNGEERSEAGSVSLFHSTFPFSIHLVTKALVSKVGGGKPSFYHRLGCYWRQGRDWRDTGNSAGDFKRMYDR